MWLPGLVLLSSLVVPLLVHCCLLEQIYQLWMTRSVVYTILKSKLLLSILDYETDLGTVRVDDGFCSA